MVDSESKRQPEPVAGKGALAPADHLDAGSQNWTFKEWERSPPARRPRVRGPEAREAGRVR